MSTNYVTNVLGDVPPVPYALSDHQTRWGPARKKGMLKQAGFFHLAPLDFETHANLQKHEIKGFTVFNQYVMPKLRKCKTAKLKGFTVLQCAKTRILLVLQLVPLNWILLALL